MMNPPIEELLDRVDSKFGLVTLAARRARNINAYFNQLGEGLGQMIPPQVSSVARKPLSIGFEEIAADKIVWREPAEPTADGGVDEGAETRRPRRAGRHRRRRLIRVHHARRHPCRPRRHRRHRRRTSRSRCAGRLVDAGAHVVPVMTRAAERFVGRDDAERPGERAGAGRPVVGTDPDPAHPPRSGRRPDRRRAGHGPADRGLRRRAGDRPADQRRCWRPGRRC